MMMWNCSNKHLLPLVAAAAALLAAYAISGQSPPAGFVNIDCGKRKGYSDTDPDTKLVYTSDFEYIDTGEIHGVDLSTISPRHYKQAHDLRSFPIGKRNCYTIKSGVEKGSIYLVKASFMYGNYDGKNSTPEFDLYLGVNFWTSVSLARVSTNYIWEIITVTTSGEVSVCLINTDSGTPFISALELRPLPTHLYHTHLTSEEASSRELMLYVRKNYQGNILRYPQDRYDRTWFSYLDDDYKTLNTTSPVESGTKTYDPPSDAMKTAIYPSSSLFSYSWTPSGFDLLQRSGFLVILHFAELQELKLNETRIFNVTVGDDVIVAKQFSPAYLVTTSLYKSDPSTIQKFSLIGTNQSTLPPIINAAEVFAVRNKIETETSSDDVDAATAIKVKYEVKKNWVGDPCSPVNFKWDGLNCSTKGFTNFKIVSINLSSSGLTGEISRSFANLSELQYLDLSRNGLTGDVPDILANLIHLKFLNLSRNKLSGDIPKALLDRSAAGTLTLDYDQSGKPEEIGHGDNGIKPTIIIVIVVIVFVFVAAVIIILCFYCRKRWRRGPAKPIHRECKQITSGDLKNITDNFKREIGRGGFGPVYYGKLDKDRVAVKMLDSSHQGPREFEAEARILTTIHHRNLVSLIGYCNEENSRSLIYEYMGEGNLRDHLSGKSGHTLSWIQRLKISIDAAQGLDYLHTGCQPAIVHRDVKSNNILLDKNLDAKLSDFGLSRFITTDAPNTASKLVGTLGYLDPELCQANNLNKTSDVYSFGVVLLELITGLPAILTQFKGIALVEWVGPKFERGQITEIIDRRICEDCEINSVWKVVETAMACVSPASIQRPTMSDVLVVLKDSLKMATKAKQVSRIDTTSTTSTTIQLPSANYSNMPSGR